MFLEMQNLLYSRRFAISRIVNIFFKIPCDYKNFIQNCKNAKKMTFLHHRMNHAILTHQQTSTERVFREREVKTC